MKRLWLASLLAVAALSGCATLSDDPSSARVLAEEGAPKKPVPLPDGSTSPAAYKSGQAAIACRYLALNALQSARNFAADLWNWVRLKPSSSTQVARAFKQNPELWTNLNVTEGNRFPTPENQLMVFNNHESMDTVCPKTIGFCWGHASIKFHLSRLAFYDPGLKFEKVPAGLETGSDAWIKFYMDKVRKIADGEPQIIPGFANLRDFSSHPKLIEWFKRAAAEDWGAHVAKPRNVGMFVSQRDYTTKEALQFIDDVKERLAQGYNPKIIFDENDNKAVKGEEKSLHVVLAVAVHPLKNDKVAIVIWDDKRPYPNNLDVLVMNPHGKGGHGYAFFWSWRWKDWDKPIGPGAGIDLGGGRVNQYRIAPENDEEARMMALNLAKFCQEHPEACKELGDARPQPIPKPELPKPGKPWKDFEYDDAPKKAPKKG